MSDIIREIDGDMPTEHARLRMILTAWKESSGRWGEDTVGQGGGKVGRYVAKYSDHF